MDIAVLRDQMRQIRELAELPLRHPELFSSIGVKPPGVSSTDVSSHVSLDVASVLFGELQTPRLLKIDRRPERTYREIAPGHHRTKKDRRWQCLR